MGNPDRGVEHTQVIVDLRGGGDRGAGIRRGDPLLDGDRRGKTLDMVHLRLLHPVEELPRVGREALHIAALPLGKERVEGERRLARTARTGDDDELVARDLDVEVAQVVLTRSFYPDNPRLVHGISSNTETDSISAVCGNMSSGVTWTRR